MDQITISVELASKLTGIKTDALTALLQGENGEQKSGADKLFYDKVIAKIADQEKELTEKADQSFAQGVAKQSKAVEKELKPVFKRLGIEASSEAIIDGLRELSNKFPEVAEPGTPDLQNLTKDQILKLPAFLDVAKEHDAEKKSIAAEWEQKYNSVIGQHKMESVVNTARSRALSALDSAGAVWGGDKSRQLDFFFKAIGTDSLDLDKENKLFLKDKNGAPLKDEARNLVDFDHWIIDNWKAAGYTFHEAPAGSGSAGANRTDATGGSKIMITSQQDYESKHKAAQGDRAKQAEITLAYSDFLAKQ